MIKSIYAAPNHLEGIEKSGANHLMIGQNGLNKQIWDQLKSLKVDLSIAVNAFGPEGCPANPQALQKLLEKIKRALKFKPIEIWIDHFRFDGHWEAIEGMDIPGVHADCGWCRGKNRAKVIADVAYEVMYLFGDKVKIGYFAVPFKSHEIPQLVIGLGQDHSKVGKIFDLSSPMLYHRMIKKPVKYIFEYIEWIYHQTDKPVLPIIQIKDMPGLADNLSELEIKQAFNEARKSPSYGVAFFYWTQALEGNKTQIISKLFLKI